jgi:hypothetical protein
MQAIPLVENSVNIPQVQPINPLEAAAQAMGIRKSQQDIQASQQNMQLNQAKLQEAQNQLDQQRRSAATMAGAYQQLNADPSYQQATDPDAKFQKELSTVGGALRQQGLIQPALEFEKMMMDHESAARSLSTAQKTELAAQAAEHAQKQGQVASSLAAYADPKAFTDDVARNSDFVQNGYPKAYALAQKLGLIDPKNPDALLPDPRVVNAANGPQVLSGIMNGISAGQGITKGISDRAKAAAEADKDAADAAKARADAAKTTGEMATATTRDQAKAQIQAMMDPKDPQSVALGQGYLRQMDALPENPKLFNSRVEDAQKTFAEYGRNVAEKTNPAVRQANIEQAAAEGGARDDAAMKKQAQADFKKAQDANHQIVDSMTQLKSVLDLAQAGNKQAQATAPLSMVQTLNTLAGMKRLNPSEIQSMKGAGSLIDSLEGKIGKIVAGKPIPDDVLNDARALFATMAQNANDSFTRNVADIDQRAGTNYSQRINPASTSDTIQVQIPGYPPAPIHRSQWNAFKAKYPNAVQLGQ